MALPEFLQEPVPLAVLTLIVFGAVHYQRGLSWTEYQTLHRFKCRVAPWLDRYQDAYFVLAQKQWRDVDDEYLTTRPGSVRSVWRTLIDAGGSPHLINSVKRRPTPDGGSQLSAAHVVWIHDDGTQTEAYLFNNPDGESVDVYVHFETSVVDADGHLSDPQTDGDVRGVVSNALGLGGA